MSTLHRSYQPDDAPDALREALASCAPEERDALLALWTMTGQAAPDIKVDAARKQAARNALLALADPAPQQVFRPAPPTFWQRVWQVRYVWSTATFAVALCLVYALAFHRIEVVAPLGDGPMAYTLPDGSQVELNAGAELEYTRTYGWTTRTVALEGEAFFDVVTSDTPFRVATHDAATTVLGTQFNVRAYPDARGGATKVTVVEGSVRVAAAASSSAVELIPGEIAMVTPEADLRTTTEHATDQTAWREGRLAFYNEPLGLIFAELSRRYDVTITVDADLTARRWVYAKEQPADLETVLDDITQSMFLQYYPTSNGYRIVAGD